MDVSFLKLGNLLPYILFLALLCLLGLPPFPIRPCRKCSLCEPIISEHHNAPADLSETTPSATATEEGTVLTISTLIVTTLIVYFSVKAMFLGLYY